MNKMNNKGFTLVELIATIVILAIVMGIGAYSITAIIENSREKDYELLIKEIVNATETYYQECKFVDNNCDSDSQITLDFLVTHGYLKGNSVKTDETNENKEKFILVNPKDNKEISNCEIKYQYSGGKITVSAVNPTGSCPTSY